MTSLARKFLFAAAAAGALAIAAPEASATPIAGRDVVSLDEGNAGLEQAHHRRRWRGYRYGWNRPYYWRRHYYRPYYWRRPYYYY